MKCAIVYAIVYTINYAVKFIIKLVSRGECVRFTA